MELPFDSHDIFMILPSFAVGVGVGVAGNMATRVIPDYIQTIAGRWINIVVTLIILVFSLCWTVAESFLWVLPIAVAVWVTWRGMVRARRMDMESASKHWWAVDTPARKMRRWQGIAVRLPTTALLALVSAWVAHEFGRQLLEEAHKGNLVTCGLGISALAIMVYLAGWVSALFGFLAGNKVECRFPVPPPPPKPEPAAVSRFKCSLAVHFCPSMSTDVHVCPSHRLAA